jgi:hypothetical protein
MRPPRCKCRSTMRSSLRWCGCWFCRVLCNGRAREGCRGRAPTNVLFPFASQRFDFELAYVELCPWLSGRRLCSSARGSCAHTTLRPPSPTRQRVPMQRNTSAAVATDRERRVDVADVTKRATPSQRLTWPLASLNDSERDGTLLPQAEKLLDSPVARRPTQQSGAAAPRKATAARLSVVLRGVPVRAHAARCALTSTTSKGIVKSSGWTGVDHSGRKIAACCGVARLGRHWRTPATRRRCNPSRDF